MKKEPQRKEKLQVEVNIKDKNDYYFVKQLSNVFFPYAPYSQQIQIVETIQNAIKKKENALIESPTGTGKTLCLLVGALSSLVDAQSRKKVFYLTRTHSQISQVVSQFKKTVYECHLNIIASREQFCINHNLSKLKGKQLQKACQDLCIQKLCPYREMTNPKRPKIAMDLHEFKDFGRKQLACPYFYSKQLTQKSQLTILPFNYLLEWSLLQRSSLDLKDAVIIFDQAHNIDTLCQQGSDIKLTYDTLNLALGQLRSIVKSQNSKSLHPQFREKAQDRQLTIDFKQQIEQLMNKLKLITQVEILSRHDILHKFQQFTTTAREVGIDLGNYSDFLAKGRKIIKFAYRKEINCESIKLLLAVIEKMYQILSSQQQFGKFAITISKFQLFFRCLDPSLCFNRIMQCKPKSIILSSGTLGDLQLWEKNLKLKFQHKITAESFVTEHHLYAQIRQKSSKGISFNFSFQGRQNDQQYLELAREFLHLEEIIKGGIVVAFSTYDLLEKTMGFCSMLKSKVFYETKGGNMENVYEQYKKTLLQNTAFLFIVMKGRFSQGINFTAELCRCLIIVGIPFLPLKDPGVVEKMKYLQATGTKQQAQEWYSSQSFKALNQTLGRAIRNKQDYAVILLYDQRFTKEQYINKLSRWFSKCLRPIKNTNEDIVTFMSKTSQKIKEINSRAKTSSKPKKQLSLCNRMAEFSTPNKSNKGRKLKLIMESDEKAEFSTGLKEIKVIEEPQYEPMKVDQQDFFINFDEFTYSQNNQVPEEDPPVQMTTVRTAMKKYKNNLDF